MATSAQAANELANGDAAHRARLRVLIAASDATLRTTLSRYLIRQWPTATITACNDDGPALQRRINTLRGYDLLLVACDFGLRSGLWNGGALDWLQSIHDSALHPPVMVLAESGGEYAAVQAMRAGASDYLPVGLLSRDTLITRVESLLGERDAGEKARAARHCAVQMGLTPYGYELRHCLQYRDRSAVFLARSRELRRDVVLKALCVDEGTLTADPEYQRFAREFSLISYFSHPAVASIYEFKAARRYCYIAMEHFPLGDLRGRLREAVNQDEALVWFGALLNALELVHQAGILHRDLKPSNVMLRDSRRVALIDFGLARQASDRDEMTVAGEIRGTPYYMSPEQATARPLDERSDLYSAGVILHELLTGRRPYVGRTPFDILQQHAQAPLPVLDGTAGALQPVLDRLLAKSPDERYASVAEVRAALSEALRQNDALRPTK